MAYLVKFVKEQKFVKVCRYCKTSYKAADVKSYTCPECKKPRKCKCGCGKVVIVPGHYYSSNHERKGKSYKEIYGTDTPACGYQRGDRNVAKRADIRKKISEGVKQSYIDSPELTKLRRADCAFLNSKHINFARRFEAKDGQKYRSRFEVEVADILFDHHLEYVYEVRVPMVNGKLKIVDFVIGDYIIEVTGYAFDNWREQFNTKLPLLRASTDKKIIIITYEKNVDELNKVVDNAKLSNILIMGNEYKTQIITELCKLSREKAPLTSVIE